jgi:ATP-dependent Lhr-like helicase
LPPDVHSKIESVTIPRSAGRVLDLFHPAVAAWFEASFGGPTRPQALGWPAIAAGESTLILAPTGTGKTLAAFLACIDRLMFPAVQDARAGARVLYVSPLKALAVDVERNLRAPLAGITRTAAARGDRYHVPAVAIRTGDTPAAERARFSREPAEILITTPESLYLLLTSNARETLASIDTIIVDEIHALVPVKRGAHLALSIERLERITRRPLQRIGLSATQRPLEEVARFLGGVAAAVRPARSRPPQEVESREPGGEDASRQIQHEFELDAGDVRYRPVTIIDTGERKRLELRVEVPVEDMARLGQPLEIPSGPASQGPVRASIWTAIHPRLLDLIRAHRSTLIFVNSRRIAERLANALNELAGETLVRSHHGSIAREQRLEVEDRLKAGQIRGLVATSSLELGIDMGAIDLVIQIESPPSVASGMQRIGRAGHQVGAPSRGVVFPKYRGDLVACAAVTEAMTQGLVESARYPRNPLDVLAQQIVAMAGMDAWNVDELFDTIRSAAPFAQLSRRIFEGVLDMLAGRYPSDEFAELRPRVTWDRIAGTITGREGARRVAVINGGTIPDRGLYGVFLAGAGKGQARVGELDEEMVFESRVGETFLLGASTWRIEEITHDRVLVTPAPGEPGKMPFWKGDAPGRPLELGQRIGRLIRELRSLSPAASIARLVEEHSLDRQAAENLVQYLADQSAAQGVPDDRTIVIERYRDELGDWRVCVLSPLGGRIHAPWAMAVAARVRDELGLDVETMWTDDGFVVRFPETVEPPDGRLLLPDAGEVEALVVRQLGSTALFAAKFREAAGRALLLPKRRPGGRAPLWQQRKRAADLLGVAARFGSFPILLETYRECLRDVFDLTSLVSTLRQVAARDIRVVTLDSATPTPFAASLLFGYVANYIYDGDAPLAERRAQALAIDQTQLRELLGEAELRELLDPEALESTERQRQMIDARHKPKTADGVHDLLLRLGDLTPAEIARRSEIGDLDAVLDDLVRARRAVIVPIAGEARYIAVEDAARYRDALGVPLPAGLPQALLAPVRDARADLALRYARTHGPFTTAEMAARHALAHAMADATLRRLAGGGRIVEGEFRPGGTRREWCDAEVLSIVRRRSLARLRHEIEPVEPRILARLHARWQGVTRRRRGLDALLDVIENLQGAPLPASIFEREILAARIEEYSPADLDTLTAGGEVVWTGVEPLGEHDGRIALYLTDQLSRLWRRQSLAANASEAGDREARITEYLRAHGASFFAPLHEAAGGGYPGETVSALWSLVWRGIVTNDTFQALRAYTRPPVRQRKAHPQPFRSRRLAPPSAEGRWSLVESRVRATTPTEWSAAMAQQLLTRYGLVSREVAVSEALPGGFSAVYEVLVRLEESGRIRRGYFVSGVGAAQFALPAAVDLLRSLRDDPEEPEIVQLAVTDPANPYGSILRWPAAEGIDEGSRGPTRVVGASIILVNGVLAAYLGRTGRQVLISLPADEPDRSNVARAVASALASIAREGDARRAGLLIAEINGSPAQGHPLVPFLLDAGFVASAMGYQVRRGQPRTFDRMREHRAL